MGGLAHIAPNKIIMGGLAPLAPDKLRPLLDYKKAHNTDTAAENNMVFSPLFRNKSCEYVFFNFNEFHFGLKHKVLSLNICLEDFNGFLFSIILW